MIPRGCNIRTYKVVLENPARCDDFLVDVRSAYLAPLASKPWLRSRFSDWLHLKGVFLGGAVAFLTPLHAGELRPPHSVHLGGLCAPNPLGAALPNACSGFVRSLIAMHHPSNIYCSFAMNIQRMKHCNQAATHCSGFGPGLISAATVVRAAPSYGLALRVAATV